MSIRLTEAEIDQLQARAYSLSATVTGVARDLIRIGLAGGDNKALADRLMQIERQLVALEHGARDTGTKVEAIDRGMRDLLAMFEALLKVLSGEREETAA